jgi:hypothetical protein
LGANALPHCTAEVKTHQGQTLLAYGTEKPLTNPPAADVTSSTSLPLSVSGVRLYDSQLHTPCYQHGAAGGQISLPSVSSQLLLQLQDWRKLLEQKNQLTTATAYPAATLLLLLCAAPSMAAAAMTLPLPWQLRLTAAAARRPCVPAAAAAVISAVPLQ